MYRWCSYCQHYLGEQEPFTDYAISHGICERCSARGAASDDRAVERGRALAAFYRGILAAASAGDAIPVAHVIETGRALGLRPVDLLIGILQPTLYEIGRLWEAGKLSAAVEARFSALCDQVLGQLTDAQELQTDPALPLTIIMNAHWNRHTLGSRMAVFLLREQGLNARALDPTPPLSELGSALAALRPATIGISVATEWQLPFVPIVLDHARTLDPRPRIIVGGAAVRAGCELPPGVERWDTVRMLR